MKARFWLRADGVRLDLCPSVAGGWNVYSYPPHADLNARWQIGTYLGNFPTFLAAKVVACRGLAVIDCKPAKR